MREAGGPPGPERYSAELSAELSAGPSAELSAAQVRPLAMGATLLGSGGGGDVAVGAQLLTHVLATRPVCVARAADLPADTLVVHVGVVGAPDILAERLIDPQDFAHAVNAVVRAAGAPAGAVGVIEIGGLNALIPLLAAAELDLPVVDGDLMGRAFPRIDQTRLALWGYPAQPIAVVGPAGDTVVIPSCAPRAVEPLIRANVAAMGGAAAVALYPVAAGTLADLGIPGSLGCCLTLGERYLAARAAGAGDFAGHIGADLLCEGRVDEIRPRQGGIPGSITLLDHASGAVVRVDLLDEFLAVTVDGTTVTATPEIIVAVDPTSRVPIRSDQLRLGRTVLMLRLPAPHRWPAEAGDVVGPAGFGLDVGYEAGLGDEGEMP